jgi:hypothetical protein
VAVAVEEKAPSISNAAAAAEPPAAPAPEKAKKEEEEEEVVVVKEATKPAEPAEAPSAPAATAEEDEPVVAGALGFGGGWWWCVRVCLFYGGFGMFLFGFLYLIIYIHRQTPPSQTSHTTTNITKKQWRTSSPSLGPRRRRRSRRGRSKDEGSIVSGTPGWSIG